MPDYTIGRRPDVKMKIRDLVKTTFFSMIMLEADALQWVRPQLAKELKMNKDAFLIDAQGYLDRFLQLPSVFKIKI